MEIKIFDKVLPSEAKDIRIKVFVEEQGFREEFDSLDNVATHIVIFDEDKAIATCRFFAKDGNSEYLIGRIAVLKEYRGMHIGAKLIEIAEEQIKKLGGTKAVIHAQCRAKDFYLKQGYSDSGKEDIEEGCPHVWLDKNI